MPLSWIIALLLVICLHEVGWNAVVRLPECDLERRLSVARTQGVAAVLRLYLLTYALLTVAGMKIASIWLWNLPILLRSLLIVGVRLAYAACGAVLLLGWRCGLPLDDLLRRWTYYARRLHRATRRFVADPPSVKTP